MQDKILIIHNIAWSHYKAAVFSAFYKLINKESFDLRVIQVAINEKGRKSLGELDLSIHQYPYKILFNKSYEETSFFERSFALIREIKNNNSDVVVVPGYFDFSYWIIVFYSKIKSKKVITGFDSTEYDHKRIWLKEQIKKIYIKMCNGAFCYGTKSAEYVEKLGMKKENIFIRCQATNNIEIEKIYSEFRKSADNRKKIYNLKQFNFLFVGRLSPEKNIELLIKAFAEVKKISEKSKDWGLIIAGDGPLKLKLEKLVENLNIKDSIFFAGGKSWKEVVEYYAISDVFILPSISEPWGLVVNEAMICNLPVIVSKKAGAYFDLVKEGENGFGFEPDNQKELENIMLKFVNNEVNVKLLGEKSKEIIKEYSPENAAKQMFKGILKIINL
jgi:glycosyltransferase involved in cell wall biosynthesis